MTGTVEPRKIWHGRKRAEGLPTPTASNADKGRGKTDANAGDMSLSNYWDKEDPAISSGKEADKPYLHQDAKAETITKEVEMLWEMLWEVKLIMRSAACLPVCMGQPKSLPDTSGEEDKGDVLIDYLRIEEKDLNLEAVALLTKTMDIAEQTEVRRAARRFSAFREASGGTSNANLPRESARAETPMKQVPGRQHTRLLRLQPGPQEAPLASRSPILRTQPNGTRSGSSMKSGGRGCNGSRNGEHIFTAISFLDASLLEDLLSGDGTRSHRTQPGHCKRNG